MLSRSLRFWSSNKSYRDRLERFDAKVDRHKRHLRDLLEIDEKVIALAERFRKKDAPGRLYKSITENKTFFNRDGKFLQYQQGQN